MTLTDPVTEAILSGALGEIAALWDETGEPFTEAEQNAGALTATHLCMAVWQLLDEARRDPHGRAATACEELAEQLAAQIADLCVAVQLDDDA